MGGGMRRGQAERGTRNADSQPARQARPALAERLDQAAAQLLMSREQLASWDRFRAAFTALQQPVGGAVASSDSAAAMRMLQLKLSQAQNHFTLVEGLADALKALEQQLDAQQRATADRVLPPLFAEFVRTGAGRDHPLGE